MKQKIFYVFFGILVLVGLVVSIYFGLNPKPIPKIKFSSIESPEKLAQAVHFRLAQEIAPNKLFAIGYQPEHPEQLKVIKYWKENGLADIWFADVNLQLGEEFSEVEKFDSKTQFEDLAKKLFQLYSTDKKIAVILPSVYSSQIVNDNFVDLFKRKYYLPIMSLTLVELLRVRDQEKALVLKCYMPDADKTGFGALGCATLQQSRFFYRKKGEPGKKTAYMDQRGALDYLIFYSNEIEN